MLKRRVRKTLNKLRQPVTADLKMEERIKNFVLTELNTSKFRSKMYDFNSSHLRLTSPHSNCQHPRSQFLKTGFKLFR